MSQPDPAAIIRYLKERDIWLSVLGGQLQVEDRQQCMTLPLKHRILANKEALIAYLKDREKSKAFVWSVKVKGANPFTMIDPDRTAFGTMEEELKGVFRDRFEWIKKLKI